MKYDVIIGLDSPANLFTKMKFLSHNKEITTRSMSLPIASPQMTITDVVQKKWFVLNKPFLVNLKLSLVFVVNRKRSIAKHANAIVLARIAVVVRNGISAHMTSPNSCIKFNIESNLCRRFKLIVFFSNPFQCKFHPHLWYERCVNKRRRNNVTAAHG